MAFLLTALVNVSHASNFEIKSDPFGTIATNGLVKYEFNENGNKIGIYYKVLSSSEMAIIATVNYEQVGYDIVPFRQYSNVQQIYDYDSGKYFYTVSTARNLDKADNLFYVMGYDRYSQQWKIYVKSANYFNPLGENAETYFRVTHDGHLLLGYRVYGVRPVAQFYNLLWDRNTNNFVYQDLGLNRIY